jgi:hypoxanthine-guanine phosphoribosyltransferase
MTTDEIKKELYKKKPKAQLMYIRKGSAYYSAMLDKEVTFKVPVDDMGDSDFASEMPAQLLSRWILN